MTLQKGGLDRPSKLRLREQKYSLSWGKKEIILIYNALHLTFPQYPPTSELPYLEMWSYIKHCEFKIFFFLAVCLELFYRMCSAFIFISKPKCIGMMYWLAHLGTSDRIVVLLFSFVFHTPVRGAHAFSSAVNSELIRAQLEQLLLFMHKIITSRPWVTGCL